VVAAAVGHETWKLAVAQLGGPSWCGPTERTDGTPTRSWMNWERRYGVFRGRYVAASGSRRLCSRDSG